MFLNSFDIQSFILKSACMLSSTNKKGEIGSAIMPLINFDVDDNMHTGTNHVYQVYLTNMSQRPCVDHD